VIFARRLIPCGTKFLRVLIFAGFSAIRKNKFPQNKNTANFFRKNSLHCRNYIQKYWFEGENAIDNSVDNTSSGTVVFVDPL